MFYTIVVLRASIDYRYTLKKYTVSTIYLSNDYLNKCYNVSFNQTTALYHLNFLTLSFLIFV